MAIDFPSSPSNNQLFVAEGKAMRYVASKGKWKQVSTLTSSQITDLEARTVGVSAMSISGNTLVIQKDDSSYANVSLASFAGNKLTSYANASILPLSDLVSGTQVYVEDTDSLYITDGSGWYKIATVNLSPSLTLGVESISLTSGGSVDVNYTVNEPEDTPYTVTASSTSNATITVYQANNTITFDTPVAATTETITITATDGVNSVGDTLTMTISLGVSYDWSSISLDQVLTTNAGSDTNALYGYSIAVDDTHLVVGAVTQQGNHSSGGYDAGRVYIYTKSGSTWSHQQTIIGNVYAGYNAFGPDGSYAGERLGYHLSLDGTTLAIAAPYSGSNGTVSNNGGAVYIYTKSGSTWSQQARIVPSSYSTNMNFGIGGIKLIGDELAITHSGNVHFYKRSGTTWTSDQIITNNSIVTQFGYGIDFKNELMVVGQPDYSGNDTSNPGGKVSVLTRSGNGSWSYSTTLQGSDTTTGDRFSGTRNVAVGDNEDYIVVGTDRHSSNAGAVYVFTGSGSSWTQQAKIQPNDTASNQWFGSRPKINSDGNILVVSSNDGNHATANSGAYYVFTKSGSTWTQETKVKANTVQANAYFYAQAFYENTSSNTVTIGSGAFYESTNVNPNQRRGRAYIYTASE